MAEESKKVNRILAINEALIEHTHNIPTNLAKIKLSKKQRWDLIVGKSLYIGTNILLNKGKAVHTVILIETK